MVYSMRVTPAHALAGDPSSACAWLCPNPARDSLHPWHPWDLLPNSVWVGWDMGVQGSPC